MNFFQHVCFSYLAEAPVACKEKVQDLLGYMLSLEGEDEQRQRIIAKTFFFVCVVGDGILEYEQLLLNLLLCYRPFYAVCFLLPMLSQITMEIEGCKALASCKGLEAVSYFLFQFLYFLFYILYFSSLFSANFF